MLQVESICVFGHPLKVFWTVKYSNTHYGVYVASENIGSVTDQNLALDFIVQWLESGNVINPKGWE